MIEKKITKMIPIVSFVPFTSSYIVIQPIISRESSKSQFAMCLNQDLKYFQIVWTRKETITRPRNIAAQIILLTIPIKTTHIASSILIVKNQM